MKTTRRPASLRMVAARAGVSIATVSRVVNGNPGRISQSTADLVNDAARALDYRSHSVGKALRTGESRVIGVLAAKLSNPVMAAIVAAIERSLRVGGFTMVLCDTHEQADLQDEHLRELDAQLARAIIMVVAVPSRRLDEARAHGRPLIFVNRRDPGSSTSPYIGVDHYQAGRDVAAMCHANGFSQPAVIYASLAHTTAMQRLDGFISGWREMGGAGELERLGGFSDDHLEGGYCAANALFQSSRQADVIIALSDLLAYGAFRCLYERRMRVPEDIAIVSFDDGPLNAWVAPWLSAVRCSFEAIGEAAMEVLQALLRDGSCGDRIVPHEIVIRTRGDASAFPALTQSSLDDAR
jgi:LacI family transcriptional regulator